MLSCLFAATTELVMRLCFVLPNKTNKPVYKKTSVQKRFCTGENRKFVPQLVGLCQFPQLQQSLFKFALKFIAHCGHAVLFGERQASERTETVLFVARL